jgi:GAF domain-containing protein
MTSPSDESAVSELQDLITQSGTVGEFLNELTLFTARTISPAIGHPVECAVALRRRRRTTTIAGSSEEARTLDQIEQALGAGPCMLALETNTTVLLNDVNRDPRWPDFQRELTARGYHAVLGIPLELGKDSWAALDLFAPAAGAFTPASIAIAEDFARIAGNALRLAVRIGTEQLLADDLKAAMRSRSTIDLACGAIMAQNHCSQETAFAILTRASNSRNKKLHQVAEELLLGLSGNVPPNDRFDA